jgi:hypothetical protein
VKETIARCLVLDLNSDFARIQTIAVRDWRNGYDPSKGVGFITHEKQSEFRKAWRGVDTTVYRSDLSSRRQKKTKRLTFQWAYLDTEVAVDPGLDRLDREILQAWHRGFRGMSRIMWEATYDETKPKHTLANLAINLPAVAPDFNWASGYRAAPLQDWESFLLSRGTRPRVLHPKIRHWADQVRRGVEAAKDSPKLVSLYRRRMESLEAYLAPFRNLDDAVVDEVIRIEARSSSTVDVLDLGSVRQHETRLLIASAVLEATYRQAQAEWSAVNDLNRFTEDTFPPRFIVIDEAHNLAPNEPSGELARTVLSQIRRIAAEGRKYKVFLLLASQRPDKLDRRVVSECSNRAVLRLDSPEAVFDVERMLGLAGVDRVRAFRMGRCLAAGPWLGTAASSAVEFATLSRRTEEGTSQASMRWARPRNKYSALRH